MPDLEESYRRYVAAIDAQARAEAALLRSLFAALDGLASAMQDWYDDRQVDAYVYGASEAVTAARRQQSQLTLASMRARLDALKAKDAARRVSPPAANPRGIPLSEEWVRPVKEYRRLRVEGLEAFEAARRANERALAMADIDVQMARRDAEHEFLNASGYTYYRRILHPENTETGPCGLCVVAASRVYHVKDLKALHTRCACTIDAVTPGAEDFGIRLNRETLDTIYAAAGGNTGPLLKRIRVDIELHGEVGPVLVNGRHRFRGPREVAKDVRRDNQIIISARAELATLEQTLKALQDRYEAGDASATAPLQWQTTRVTALRRLVADAA